MAFIPGYEYDIFISYAHVDNRKNKKIIFPDDKEIQTLSVEQKAYVEDKIKYVPPFS
jgi:hypothetical protein